MSVQKYQYALSAVVRLQDMGVEPYLVASSLNMVQAQRLVRRLCPDCKQAWRGGMVEYVPAAYTSQRCSQCGHTAKANRLSQSKFQCVQCHHAENADFNAAKNILASWRQGIAASACGVDAIATTMKQEPLAV